MTRINVLPPEVLLDSHLAAALREGLRPLNKVLANKYKNLDNAPETYTLSKGHELFHATHLKYTKDVFLRSQAEWRERGFKGFDYQPSTLPIPDLLNRDYKPSVADLRHNLARVIVRWRKKPENYFFKGKPVHTLQTFKEYVSMVKSYCGLL